MLQEDGYLIVILKEYRVYCAASIVENIDMNIEKKGIICGAIWGLISLKYAMSEEWIKSIYGIDPDLLKLIEDIIYLPAKIVSLFGILIFGDFPEQLLIIIWPFYIIGTIFIGGFFGYLISKIIKEFRK